MYLKRIDEDGEVRIIIGPFKNQRELKKFQIVAQTFAWGTATDFRNGVDIYLPSEYIEHMKETMK